MSNTDPSLTPVDLLRPFGLSAREPGIFPFSETLPHDGPWISSHSPVDGKRIAEIWCPTRAQYDRMVDQSREAFDAWRMVPAPGRGAVVRQIGESIRARKGELGRLVSYEMGKSLQEGLGEVQEMIDICDFAVGLSRQLYGLSMHSERPGHRMYEQWHPLGPTGIISAFNFPVAVWSWNAMLALVCGDTVIWKPSEKTPVCALACTRIVSGVLADNGLPQGICGLVVGAREAGQWLASDPRIPLVSATGSVRMGKSVAATVGQRLGRALLELGGNNAIIITENGDLDLSMTACLFGAVGTAGQRCTTTRRLIIQEKVYETFREKLVRAFRQLRIGNPLDSVNHMGPLIDREAVALYLRAIDQVKKEGGHFVLEGGILEGPGFESGCYVRPGIAEVTHDLPMVHQETFAPILYLIRYEKLEEAIRYQNEVPQGLSSAIMTTSLRDSERFLSASGSDCGIANVNIGTSGAEIGGAFGGEKDTGGGRESGSDAWKNYMRRQTSTINFTKDLPLAQGIHFDL
ncbi:MAG TPA: aldehyde dehydrogenase family protein [Chitinophagaceae bacterium]|nr:aldehyde dehydrogenase family protein [Chitinophagaceae bacterium]